MPSQYAKSTHACLIMVERGPCLREETAGLCRISTPVFSKAHHHAPPPTVPGLEPRPWHMGADARAHAQRAGDQWQRREVPLSVVTSGGVGGALGEGSKGCHAVGNGGQDGGLVALAVEPRHGGAEGLGDHGGPTQIERGGPVGGLAALCCIVQQEERAAFITALSTAADPCALSRLQGWLETQCSTAGLLHSLPCQTRLILDPFKRHKYVNKCCQTSPMVANTNTGG